MANQIFNTYKEQVQSILESMIECDRQDRIYYATNNFAVFCLYYFHEYFKKENADFHYEMFEVLQELAKEEADFDELLIVGFRGCAKTTIVQLWFLWLIACKPDRKYLNWDSYDGENAERTLYELSQLMMNSPDFIVDFGRLYVRDKTKGSSSQNRIDNFTTTNDKRVESNTTQVDVRGRKHFETRPNVRVLDDFENMVTKDSPVKTQSIRQNIMSAVGGIAPRGIMVYLGNYLTEHGNVQYLIDRAKTDPKIKVLMIPILKDGQPTWKERFVLTDEEAKITGKESVEAIQRKFGSFQFSYDFMNTPVDEAQSEFKKEFAQVVSEEAVRHLNTLTYITIDSAVKETETADFTGVSINRVSDQNKWYVYSFREKINSKGLIDLLFRLWDEWKPEVIGVEETTFVTAIKPFLDDEMRKRNIYIRFKLLKHKSQNKVTRIRALIPRWESRSIFLVGENLALREEMRAFPNGANDDTLDSFAYQLDVAKKPLGGVHDSDDWGVGNEKKTNPAR